MKNKKRYSLVLAVIIIFSFNAVSLAAGQPEVNILDETGIYITEDEYEKQCVKETIENEKLMVDNIDESGIIRDDISQDTLNEKKINSISFGTSENICVNEEKQSVDLDKKGYVLNETGLYITEDEYEKQCVKETIENEKPMVDNIDESGIIRDDISQDTLNEKKINNVSFDASEKTGFLKYIFNFIGGIFSAIFGR